MLRVASYGCAVLAVTALAFVSSPAQASQPRVSTTYELPGRKVYPEGITADPHTGDLYTGSYEDGTIFKLTPGHRVAEQFLPAGADGRTRALGLKVDQAGRLWAIDVNLGVAVYDLSGRSLLVVDMTGGDLYRIDLFSHGIRKVALDGGDLRYADGMELRQDRLWVAHANPAANAISRWQITRDGRAARAERRVTDQDLQLPTTLVHRNGTLFVVRS